MSYELLSQKLLLYIIYLNKRQYVSNLDINKIKNPINLLFFKRISDFLFYRF